MPPYLATLPFLMLSPEIYLLFIHVNGIPTQKLINFCCLYFSSMIKSDGKLETGFENGENIEALDKKGTKKENSIQRTEVYDSRQLM